jgi:chemotaxis protein CheD
MITPVSQASYAVSTNLYQTLVAYPLHESLGVAVYDPGIGVGGMLHFTRPDSKESPEQAKASPATFADTGISAFLWEVFKNGATRKGLKVKLAGGARMFKDTLGVGERNYLMAKRVLWKHNLVVASEAVGGNSGVHLKLEMSTGAVVVKSNNVEMTL